LLPAQILPPVADAQQLADQGEAKAAGAFIGLPRELRQNMPRPITLRELLRNSDI
jgi:hypothetical protein